MERQKKTYASISVYLKGNGIRNYDIIKRHAEETGKSVSELMHRGMECVALEQECSVQVSPGAYFAMQDGRFDVLTRIYLADGTSLITVTEDAYKPKDGSSGYGDKVQEFLSGMKGENNGK